MNSQIRLNYDKSTFNSILELAYIMNNTSDEKLRNDSEKFINKTMKYSYVKDERVFMNLYPSETKFLISILINNIKDINPTKDWYVELIKNKEEFKKEKEGGHNA